MYPHIGLSRWCRLFGYSRQAFYQQIWSLSDKTMEEQLILKMVLSIRSEQPRIGVRKLYIMLEEQLHRSVIKIGRDALFDLLARENLLVKKRKRKYPHTTNSTGWFKKYEDLTIGFQPFQSNQMWVADITYITVTTKFIYLSLLTDAYSHQIVGWSLQETLVTDGPLDALRMALKICKPITGLIHHSDRGAQYRSLEYVNLLQDYQICLVLNQKNHRSDNK